MLVNVVLVVGLYTFAGNSAILSFGHMSFMAIGAYATALLTIPPDPEGVPACRTCRTALAERGAADPGRRDRRRPAARRCSPRVIAIPIVRCPAGGGAGDVRRAGDHPRGRAGNWDAVTRGSRTMLGVPTDTTIDLGDCCGRRRSSSSPTSTSSSKLGLRLRASREDDFAARAVGINVPRERGDRVRAQRLHHRDRRLPLRPVPGRVHPERLLHRDHLPDDRDARRRRHQEPRRGGRSGAVAVTRC